MRGEGAFGVVGDGSKGAGVPGRHKASGEGVRGEGSPGVVGHCTANAGGREGPLGPVAGVRGDSTSGPGVYGDGRYGGQFKGTSAQLSLVPGPSVGHPTTGHHVMGALYMDSAASLFVCAATGYPRTWVKVVTA